MPISEDKVGPVKEVKSLEEGDRILFGDRATPLEVKEVEDEEAVVCGAEWRKISSL